MTAVEWLQDKWGNCKEWSWEEIKQWFEQAKQMEKQQIIDAAERLKWVDYSLVQNGEQYYNDTFGNKGSGVLTEGSGAVGEKGGAVTSSQTEISDEEIEQEAHIQYPVNLQPNGRTLAGGRYDIDINYSERNAYILSAKWMRDKIQNK